VVRDPASRAIETVADLSLLVRGCDRQGSWYQTVAGQPSFGEAGIGRVRAAAGVRNCCPRFGRVAAAAEARRSSLGFNFSSGCNSIQQVQLQSLEATMHITVEITAISAVVHCSYSLSSCLICPFKGASTS
jgi:hypothetical protein